MSKPRILIASLTDHTTDGRVARQVRLLAKHYSIISAGTGSPPIDGVESVELEKPGFQKNLWHRLSSAAMLLGRSYERYYWSRPWVKSALHRLNGVDADLILVNDLPLLPVAIRIADQRPVIFDAHEYYPRQHEEQLFFRLLLKPYINSLCRNYLYRASVMYTVSPGLATEYEKNFGVRPMLVRNVPPREFFRPSRTSPERIRLVYHGGANPNRQLKTIVEAGRRLGDRFELHLILKGSERQLNSLRSQAAGCGTIVFHAPVPNIEICQKIRQFDLGVVVFEPLTFNLKHCLPNKFFEFIQARLGVVIGPSPDMSHIVEREGCGVITPDYSVDSLVETLRKLTHEDVARFKQRSDEIAPKNCWEVDSNVLLATIEKTLGIAHDSSDPSDTDVVVTS